MIVRHFKHIVPYVLNSFHPHTSGHLLDPQELSLFFYIDGSTSIDDISLLTSLGLMEIYNTLVRMKEQGIVDWKEPEPPQSVQKAKHTSNTWQQAGSSEPPSPSASSPSLPSQPSLPQHAEAHIAPSRSQTRPAYEITNDSEYVIPPELSAYPIEPHDTLDSMEAIRQTDQEHVETGVLPKRHEDILDMNSTEVEFTLLEPEVAASADKIIDMNSTEVEFTWLGDEQEQSSSQQPPPSSSSQDRLLQPSHSSSSQNLMIPQTWAAIPQDSPPSKGMTWDTWKGETASALHNTPDHTESTNPRKTSFKRSRETLAEEPSRWEGDEIMSEDYLRLMLGDRIDTHTMLDEHKHAASVLQAFARVSSSFQLYDPRNNAVRDALLALYSTLTSFLHHYEKLPLIVEPWEFLYRGYSVYRNRDREYSLAFRLFRDGVRGITFCKGIPWPELATFLRILGMRYHGVHMFEDDIVSLVWKANFSFIETLAVEGFEESHEHSNPTQQAEELLYHMLERESRDDIPTDAPCAYGWQTEESLEEENLSTLLSMLRVESPCYHPLSSATLTLLQEEVDVEHLPDRIHRLLDVMKQEVCHPVCPMPVEPLLYLIQDFRDYLLTERRLQDLLWLWQTVESWQTSHPISLSTKENTAKTTELASIYAHFIEDFREPRMLRRLIDAIKLQEDKQEIESAAYQLLAKLPMDPVPLLFPLLETENLQSLRIMLRHVLVSLTHRNTSVFLSRLPEASPSFTLELLYCLYMIRDADAVEGIVAQIDHPSQEVQYIVLKLIDRLIREDGHGLAVYEVISKLLLSTEYAVRQRAYRLIEVSGETRWASLTLRLLQEDPHRDAEEQRQLARLSAFLSPQQAFPVLEKMAKPPGFLAFSSNFHQPQRIAAISGLALIGTPEAETLIKDILHKLGEQDEQVYDACIQAMREIRRRSHGTDSSDLLELHLDSLSSLGELDSILALRSSFERLTGVETAEPMAQELLPNTSTTPQSSPVLDATAGGQEVDIKEIQQQMLRALQHSDSGHENFSGHIRKRGYELVLLLHMLVKTSRLYGADNQIFTKPFQDITAMMEQLMGELGEVALMGVKGSFYLNDVRIRLQRESADIGLELFEDLQHAGVGGITFSIPFSTEQWRTFIQCLSHPIHHGQTPSLSDLEAELQRKGVGSYVTLVGELDYRIGEEEKPLKIGVARSMLNAYSKANDAAQSLWDSVSVGRIPNPLPVRHASNEFVDALKNREVVNPLEVLALGKQAHPFNTHILDTTIYALMIGKEIGLSHSQLADLAMAAFFHDVGYAVPSDTDGTPSPSLHLSHTQRGLRFLAKQHGLQDTKIQRLLAVVEHHANVNETPIPCLFARILRIADVYSLLTEPVLASQPALSSHHVLCLLWSGRGTYFDASLLQAFVNTVGYYPPSTLLELSDHSLAISMGYSGQQDDFARPRVLLVQTATGIRTEGPILDLAQESYRHLDILRVIEPTEDIPVKAILARILRDRIRIEKQAHH